MRSILQKIINAERCAAREINYKKVSQIHRLFPGNGRAFTSRKLLRSQSLYLQILKNKDEKKNSRNKTEFSGV